MEIQVKKLYCVSKALPTLPINIEDAARSEVEIEKALQVLISLPVFPTRSVQCKTVSLRICRTR